MNAEVQVGKDPAAGGKVTGYLTHAAASGDRTAMLEGPEPSARELESLIFQLCKEDCKNKHEDTVKPWTTHTERD